jgi:hypothetical protein
LEKPYVVSGLALVLEFVAFVSAGAIMFTARDGLAGGRKTIVQVLIGMSCALAFSVVFFALAPGPRIAAVDLDPVVVGALLIALLMPVVQVILYRRYSRLGAR